MAQSIDTVKNDNSAEESLTAQALWLFFRKMAPLAPFDDLATQERAVSAVLRHERRRGATTLFVEYPLLGDESFDLHVYPALNHQSDGRQSDDGQTDGRQAEDRGEQDVLHESFLQWCENQPPRVAEGGFAYDLSSHPIAHNASGLKSDNGTPGLPVPCLYAAFFSSDKSSVPQALDALGSPQFTPMLREILPKLESGQRVYYVGAMHGRVPQVAHIGYRIEGELKEAYRNSPRLLFEHLNRVGFSALDAEAEGARFAPFARLGFSHDVQYAFDEAGVIPETLAFSFVPGLVAPGRNKEGLRDGVLNKAFVYLENEVGLSDGRWRALEQVVGSWMVPYDSFGAVKFGAVGITVAGIKIRWERERGAYRAKVYVTIQAVP